MSELTQQPQFNWTDPNAVNVVNITTIDPTNVARWSSVNILGLRLPEPGPNTAVSTLLGSITELLGVIPNRQSLASELYGIATGSLANMRVAKKFEKSVDVDHAITQLSAIQDLLYRAIQTLQTMYDGASRLLTAAEHQQRLGGQR